MAKRNRAGGRKAARARQRRQQVILGGALVAIIAVLVGVLVASSGGGSAPQVPEERLQQFPALGSANAPVTIREYGAYGCSACAQWHNAGIIEQILDEYAGQVRFEYHHMPIIAPAYSQQAAEVAECTLDQGEELFWRTHDAFFRQAGPGSSQTQLISIAVAQGADVSQLRECVDSGRHDGTVTHALQQGQQLGIRATPTFFVNDQRVFQANPDTLRQIINQELATVGG